ncbi:hypothetical protein [uncultured Ilyobacter sp.]|uniref:hypothetical protein n=1 Tax=uncultured Ilyobacter sp. TaxID=544433 RepID=UPI0029F58C82|nr:hypothetical protein [uncultured Ilyobacter sp.]
MDKKWSVKEICEKIWEIEEEEKLFEISIDNIFVWELIRMEVYYEITKKLGVFGTPHAEKMSKIEKIKYWLILLKDAILNNPYLYSDNADYLIYDHQRKVKKEKKYVDIYTDYFLKNLKNKFLIIEDPVDGKHLSSRENNIKFNDLIFIISGIIYKLMPIKENKSFQNIFGKLKSLEKAFKIDLNLEKYLEKKIKKHKVKYFLYKKLMKKLNVKKVFVVVSYCKIDFIRAAKDLGIQVNEFQHGTISKYHLGYSYPYNSLELKYFPDKFYSFGKYWNNFLPSTKLEIENYGFRHFRETKLKEKDKKKNQILFISQGVIGEKLSEMAIEVAKKLKGYKIIYKLHPSEYNRWNKYQNLYKNKDLSNLEIIDNNNKNLYELFNESEYQVGVFSTAIYEGLAYSCKTLLYDLPGIEYMKDLIDDNYCYKFSNIDEFILNLEKGFNKKVDPNDFF